MTAETRTPGATTAADAKASVRPWPALWALVLGFFLILLDGTIVAVANPAILADLHTDIDQIIWVTSAYLLAYAVPVLVTGRLGDRYGPKTLYLTGLAVFTAASVWCGLATSITMLITARVVQGLGAALLTPQTMTVITRVFPPEQRGAALGVWGSVAGAASLSGPILGGVLVDHLGWEWIFLVNLPIGAIAFGLAARLLPRLDTRPHRFDLVGVALSGVGLFLLIFGIQEGPGHGWGRLVGRVPTWAVIGGGLVVLVAFVLWQRTTRAEPLVPLRLFRDRNFSLANAAIATVGFTVLSLNTPLVFYLQVVRGMSPTRSALMLVPCASIMAAVSPFAGRLIGRISARAMAMTGLVLLAAGLAWYATLMAPDTDTWLLLLPSALLGLASSAIWAPISVTATRNLPRELAGAGSGIYNTTRQVGSVLGSASIAALITARLAVELPAGHGEHLADGGRLPAALVGGFSDAMAQTMLLPAAVALLGATLVAGFVAPTRPPAAG